VRVSPASPEQSTRGFVLVAVLWILMALSSLALIFAAYLSTSARAMAVNDTALQVDALASAGVELTAYQLLLTGDDSRPTQGSFRFRMDGADVGVMFTSEAARIDLNFAPKELLAAFFGGLGADKDTASENAERVVAWRTRPVPGSANNEATRYAALGYSPRQALFAHVNELALVADLSPALVERALPFVTIFNGSSAIDAAIAAPEVLVAFDQTVNANKEPYGGAMASADGSVTGAGVPASPKVAAPAAKSPCYRVEVTIALADGHRVTSEVVIVLGDKNEPYRVLSWQADIDRREAQIAGRRS